MAGTQWDPEGRRPSVTECAVEEEKKEKERKELKDCNQFKHSL